jgi:hypothetical protein
MTPGRRRVDVNIEELDRVLDGAREAPLSEADCEKGLLSRICGWIPVQVVAPSYDREPFPWLQTYESRRIVW